MFTKLKQKFQDNPKFYYAMSIAASWAGAGSLMNSTTLANTLGVIPSLIWCVCNTLACIVFGLVIWYLPTVRSFSPDAYIRQIDGLYKIQAGAFSVKENAVKYRDSLRAAGFVSALITT